MIANDWKRSFVAASVLDFALLSTCLWNIYLLTLTINFLISFYTPETMFYTVYFLVVQILIIILGQGVTILCLSLIHI